MRLNNGISRILLALTSIVAGAILWQCSLPSNERSQFFQIPADGWRYGEIFSFTPLDSSATSTADVVVAVRNTNAYEYSSIWVELSYHLPSEYASQENDIETDTFKIMLADNYGRWHGKGVGVGFQLADTVLKQTKIDLTKPISLRHIMRADTLQGIEQMGIIVKY